ncbi:MAG: LamG domain-containing protein [Bacteroidota bacterium]
MKTKTILTAAVLFLISYTLYLIPLSFAQPPNLPGAGNCLSFNGTSDYVNCGNSNSLNPSSEITVTAWINNPSAGGGIVGKHEWTSPSYAKGWFFATNGATLYFGIGNGSTDYDIVFVGSILSGVWYHITGVYSGGITKCYINGILITTNSSTAYAPYGAGDLFIGGCGGGGSNIGNGCGYFNGKIDEVSIWNRALSQTEIRDNMCQKLTGSEAGLVGYWRFDETSGTTAYDSSPNGNNGTLK